MKAMKPTTKIILYDETLSHVSLISKKARMPALAFLCSNVLENPASAVNQERETKDIQIGKYKVK